MTLVLNKSIRDCYIPQAYCTKEAKIVPQKGAANESGNYRPVTLLSALSKIFEKAICCQLMIHLGVNTI